jgi:alpha-tubulin suppressor-like RCC1 family protein
MRVPGVVAASAVVSTGPSFNDLEVDDEYSCALLPGGGASCWGDDGEGTLGDGGSSIDVSTPVAVVDLSGATQLALGGGHACAILADGSATCWGKDLVMLSPTPTAVPGLAGVVAIAAGSVHTCALLAVGTVACWGDATFGQLGSGATSLGETATPAAVPSFAGVTAIAAGGDHTCALLGDGTIQCWGSNVHGQLGDGLSEETHAAPIRVVGITDAVAVSAGIDFSCALLGDGTVRCWGNNDQGQLGNGGPPAAGLEPVDVLTPVEVISGDVADGGSD